MSICIVIPSFNENENINLLLDEIYKLDLNNFYIVIIDDSIESFQNRIKFINNSFVVDSKFISALIKKRII